MTPSATSLPQAGGEPLRHAAGRCLLLALAAWWTASPYRAFDQDALYYAAEALFRGGLADLSADPFFHHGSQGDYSLFIRPFAGLIRALGVDSAALALTVAGRLLWLLAAARLAVGLAPTWTAAVGALALLLWLPSDYEPFRLLALGEPFAVPRLWAEAVGLLGLAEAVRRHHGRALLLTLLACGLHPLMGVAALAVLALLWPGPRAAEASGPSWPTQLGRLVLAAGLLGGLAWGGLAPFDRLLARYDPAWWQIVVTRNYFTVTDAWSAEDFAGVAAWWAVLGWAAWRLPAGSAGRRLGQALWLVAAASLLAWVLSCALRAVLGVQVQLWRVLWLVHAIVPLLLVAAWARPGDRGPAEQAQAALAVGAMLAGGWGALVLASLLLAWGGPWPLRSVQLSPGRQRALALSLLALVLLTGLAELPGLRQSLHALGASPHAWPQALAQTPAVGLLLSAGVWALARAPARRGVLLRHLPTLAATALLLAAVVGWWLPAQARLQRSPAWVAALAQALPPGQTVYWQQPLERTWLDLRRPHYAHALQGASALFSRPQALELQRRLRRLQAVGLTEGPSEWPEYPSRKPLDERSARWLCEDPALDLVLLEGRWPLATRQLRLEPGQDWSIFECAAWHRPHPGDPS